MDKPPEITAEVRAELADMDACELHKEMARRDLLEHYVIGGKEHSVFGFRSVFKRLIDEREGNGD